MQQRTPVLPCACTVTTTPAYRALQSGALLCCSVAPAGGDPGLPACAAAFQWGCHWTARGPRCFSSMVAVRIRASAGARPLDGAGAAACCRRASLMISAAATAAGQRHGRETQVIPTAGAKCILHGRRPLPVSSLIALSQRILPTITLQPLQERPQTKQARHRCEGTHWMQQASQQMPSGSSYYADAFEAQQAAGCCLACT